MARRFALMIALAAVGLLGGHLAGGGVAGLLGGPLYAPVVTALLAIGLYGSTRSISISTLRGDLRTVILAVTVGVVAKAVLITAVMLPAFREPGYLVLGVAVAQIDPLSVVALGRRSRLSERSRGLLLAWASFDDPVTTLLTIYVAGVAVSLRPGGTASGLDLGGPLSFLLDLLGNLAVAAAAALLYALARRLRPYARFAVCCAVLAAVFAVAVWQTWVLAVALAGLYVRPEWPGRPERVTRVLERAVDGAFTLAILLLGLVLSLGIAWLPGIVLGLAAFAAQALVSLPLTRTFPAPDRVRLALAQQNGITAIILALLLEPAFGGTVAVVAPAILLINALYLGGNALYDRATTVRDLVLAVASRPPRRPRSAARAARGEILPDVMPEVGQPGRDVELSKPPDLRAPE